ncbi:MAG: DNA polymerase IV, partial [Gammaproteobacteria bacterium]|nr:DNA polymerase IV [Gammaproteobacteria bacterium]
MGKHAFNPWPRAIILVDMNAFFASVEQLDHPEWRGRPVAITNGLTGTCIITCSYEARGYGVKTGMRLKQARKICPGLIQCSANPVRYAEISTRIMKSLEDITPEIEIFSVDEAFLDVTHSQKLLGTPEYIAQLTKDKVFEASGILCSVGVSGDKTTAKYAAKLNKPDGLTVIPPWLAKERLSNVKVTDLCGINHGIGGFLADRGVHVCGDMKKLPIGELAKRFGNPGRRIWYMCQGEDPDELHQEIAAPKTIGHGKVMPPNTKDRNVLLTYLLHMSEKVVARLRRHNLVAQIFFVGLRCNDGWLGRKMKTGLATNDGHLLMNLCRAV